MRKIYFLILFCSSFFFNLTAQELNTSNVPKYLQFEFSDEIPIPYGKNILTYSLIDFKDKNAYFTFTKEAKKISLFGIKHVADEISLVLVNLNTNSIVSQKVIFDSKENQNTNVRTKVHSKLILDDGVLIVKKNYNKKGHIITLTATKYDLSLKQLFKDKIIFRPDPEQKIQKVDVVLSENKKSFYLSIIDEKEKSIMRHVTYTFHLMDKEANNIFTKTFKTESKEIGTRLAYIQADTSRIFFIVKGDDNKIYYNWAKMLSNGGKYNNMKLVYMNKDTTIVQSLIYDLDSINGLIENNFVLLNFDNSVLSYLTYSIPKRKERRNRKKIRKIKQMKIFLIYT